VDRGKSGKLSKSRAQIFIVLTDWIHSQVKRKTKVPNKEKEKPKEVVEEREEREELDFQFDEELDVPCSHRTNKFSEL